MAVTPEMVKQLREKTGAGVMDCKRALEEAQGDVEKAIEILRKKGLEVATKKRGREAREGLIASYIHPGGRIGVLVEINCETDFVARTELFKEFVKDITMQIAASDPRYISREDVPEEVLEQEKSIIAAQFEGKPPHVIEKIVSGKLEKFYEENCLLEQPFIKDPDKSIKDYLTEIVAKLGENVVIRRFVRYQLGEEI